MRKLLDKSVIGTGLALLSPVALAAQLEEAQALVGMAGLYALGLITIVTAVFVYFMQLPSQDKRAAPLHRLLSANDATHTVEADALVVDCITKMTDERIGALLVMNGEKLTGIFTERDALRNVLLAGRDPHSTRVCEVMTLDPCCVSPGTTVAAAMELATKKQVKHLPIVEDGKVHAVLSSRDLTQWLAKGRIARVQEPVTLPA